LTQGKLSDEKPPNCELQNFYASRNVIKQLMKIVEQESHNQRCSPGDYNTNEIKKNEMNGEFGKIL
jgi:hypothetical protein